MALRNKITIPTSAYFLIIANTMPVCGAIFLGWNIADIMFVYWAETLVIGIFNLFKIRYARDSISAARPRSARIFRKLQLAGYFALHFGGFAAIHGFILYMISLEFLKIPVQPLHLIASTWSSLVLLLISHTYSFLNNFMKNKEHEHKSDMDVMFEPYYRVVVMHVSLLLGLGLIIVIGQPLPMLLLFVVLKTGLDLAGHLRERKRFIASE